MFGCIEVELKPCKKVVEYIAKLGYDYNKLGKPKIVYTSYKVYSISEIEEIFAGNWTLIKIGKFNQKQIKKLRRHLTDSIFGEDKIEVGLLLEEYLNKSFKKVIRAQNPIKHKYSVYVFRLSEKACEANKLVKLNPTENRIKKAFYIGQTSLSIEERFQVHTDTKHENHAKGSVIMKQFAVSKKFNDCNVTDEIAELSGIRVQNLSYYESLKNERDMASFIRDRLNFFSYHA